MVWSGLGALASAGIGAIGSTINSALSFHKQKQLIAMQQNWQERMSNTAHQREVKDLKEAGLNPMLSVNSGASFGGATAATSDFDTGIQNAMSSAMDYKTAKANIDNIKATNEKTSLEADNQRMANHFQPSLLGAQLENIQAGTEQSTAAAGLMAAQKLGHDIDNTYKDVLNKSQIANLKASTYNLTQSAINGFIAANSTAGFQAVSAHGQQLTNYKMEAQAEWARKHPKQAAFLYGANQWLSPIGSALTGAAGATYLGKQIPKSSRPVGFSTK